MSREINMKKKINKSITATETRKEEGRIETDPFGSWTGVNAFDEYEEPIQDVDDL